VRALEHTDTHTCIHKRTNENTQRNASICAKHISMCMPSRHKAAEKTSHIHFK